MTWEIMPKDIYSRFFFKNNCQDVEVAKMSFGRDRISVQKKKKTTNERTKKPEEYCQVVGGHGGT